MSFESLFHEIAAILAISAVMGALAVRLRQPLLVAFIAVGVLVGPSGISLVSAHEPVRLLAELGISILLFAVGLKLDVHLIRTMGSVALATGLGQVVFTSAFGFLIALALGMPALESVYVAVALTFSSTIIIVKLLSDKREIDSLHGRIAVGFLIVQDIAAVAALVGLTALGAGSAEGGLLQAGAAVAGKGLAWLALVALLMRFVLPRLLDHLARSPELLLLAAVSWAALLSATGELLGFSREVGAFVAGVALASTSYREAIASRLVPLRDFLLLFFFLDLGARLDLSTLGGQLLPATLFSVFVLVGNPLIVMAIMGAMGYRKRTGFLAGLAVAQISEFSLILGAMGVTLGHLSSQAMGLITLVGLVTIGLSTYLILYSHPLYQKLAPLLGIFERRHAHREEADGDEAVSEAEVILFGLGRYGRHIAEHLVRRGRRVLGVDFDPQAVAECRAGGLAVRYGDAEDPDLLEHLPLERARWVVNASPDRSVNLSLLRALRRREYRGQVVLTAHSRADADAFRSAGADRVLWPFEDAAEQAADSLSGVAEEIQEKTPWPVTLAEVSVRPGSVSAGRSVKDLDLRRRTGAQILAVDRAGQNLFEIGPDFQVFPADRLILLGTPAALEAAREALAERADGAPVDGEVRFRIEELPVSASSPWAGRSIAELDLRRRHGVNVVGVQRGQERILAPDPAEVLRPGDVLVVAGSRRAIDDARDQEVTS